MAISVSESVLTGVFSASGSVLTESFLSAKEYNYPLTLCVVVKAECLQACIVLVISVILETLMPIPYSHAYESFVDDAYVMFCMRSCEFYLPKVLSCGNLHSISFLVGGGSILIS